MTAIPHGTASTYTNHSCRCRACRDAWTAYNLEIRRRRTARGLCIQCPRPRYGTHVRCKPHHDALLKKE